MLNFKSQSAVYSRSSPTETPENLPNYFVRNVSFLFQPLYFIHKQNTKGMVRSSSRIFHEGSGTDRKAIGNLYLI